MVVNIDLKFMQDRENYLRKNTMTREHVAVFPSLLGTLSTSTNDFNYFVSLSLHDGGPSWRTVNHISYRQEFGGEPTSTWIEAHE